MTVRPTASLWPWIGPAILLLLVAPFVVGAVVQGLDGLNGGPSGSNRLFAPGATVSNTGIFGHMVAGGIITALAPLQILGPVRRRWPRLHRASGYVLATAGLVTALGGLLYISVRGTIGGPQMSVAFATYGLCLALAAVQTLRYARMRMFARHRRWALRLVVLCLASWLYRVQYTVWVMALGRFGIGEAFEGPFDRVMNWAFFVPWLVLLELWLRLRRDPVVAQPDSHP